ncbi:MAG: dihydroorotate dehydrogenase electron transfer subunit [Nitrospirae bacterium]|nr:dihydroorotate dehydrogenase electron transfer subunit [Nitrospirota bacterium]
MQAVILSNLSEGAGYYKIALTLPGNHAAVKPGQFLMVRPVQGYEPLLPRPFSVYRNPAPGQVELLYKVIGKGTALLAQRRSGETLEVQGPFGNSFPIPDPKGVEEILLVGGGIGVAPLVILAESMLRYPITVFIGGREKTDVLCVDDFERMGLPVKPATQDGSLGFRGVVTEALESYLAGESRKSRVLYACGPHPMLSRVAQIVSSLSIPAYFSLEAVMACGMGLCMGCAERGAGEGYPLVCQDGPIFRPEEIKWE